MCPDFLLLFWGREKDLCVSRMSPSYPLPVTRVSQGERILQPQRVLCPPLPPIRRGRVICPPPPHPDKKCLLLTASLTYVTCSSCCLLLGTTENVPRGSDYSSHTCPPPFSSRTPLPRSPVRLCLLVLFLGSSPGSTEEQGVPCLSPLPALPPQSSLPGIPGWKSVEGARGGFAECLSIL